MIGKSCNHRTKPSLHAVQALSGSLHGCALRIQHQCPKCCWQLLRLLPRVRPHPSAPTHPLVLVVLLLLLLQVLLLCNMPYSSTTSTTSSSCGPV
jgi:hypothetical protein